MTPEQKARQWLAQQGLPYIKLVRLPGYTNHVFRITQTNQANCPNTPKSSIIRLANTDLGGMLCPLNTDTLQTIQKHQHAEKLGLAPELLAFDVQEKIMWLADAGDTKTVEPADFQAIAQQLAKLHDSPPPNSFMSNTQAQNPKAKPGQDQKPSQKQSQTAESFQLLDSLTKNSTEPALQKLGLYLQEQNQQHGYSNYPQVAIHSDLNPGNWLHDGQRWWLIDWDFATLAPREWDYASLIVEQGWTMGQALAFAPHTPQHALCWFCCHFALLSWQWHQERQSPTEILRQKQESTAYWARHCGYKTLLTISALR